MSEAVLDAGRSGEHVEGAPSAADRVRAIVDGHFDSVARLLRGLGVPEGDVEDAAQQVFLVASGRLADILPGAERAFVYRTALNVAAHARRSIARRREAPEVDSVCGAPSPEDVVDQLRARLCLDRILEAMPLDLRAVFVLFEIDEMSSVEIAQVLEVPVGTVASRLRRARADFEQRVKRWQARARDGGGR
jgi:RNA polymerase sigma-70 factor (ECF subfamily)